MNSKGGLGRGLDSLLPTAMDQEENDSYFFCPVDAITPNPYQPRKEFNPATLAELSESIREKGMIQPLTVLKKDGNEGGYLLITGERRWRASIMAGLTEVPVIVRNASSEDLLEMALIENIQRQDLNPIEEAEAYQKLTTDFGLTQKELAKKVGKMRTTIANMLRLLNLPDYLKKDIIDNRLTAGHARALLSVINDQEVLRKFRNEIIARGLSVRQAEQLIKKFKDAASAPSKDKTDDLSNDEANPYGKTLANTLRSYLGSPTKILARGARGRIIVEYNSPEDLERITALILKDSEITGPGEASASNNM
jgi:ParB family chromosome partitioning protein